MVYLSSTIFVYFFSVAIAHILLVWQKFSIIDYFGKKLVTEVYCEDLYPPTQCIKTNANVVYRFRYLYTNQIGFVGNAR